MIVAGFPAGPQSLLVSQSVSFRVIAAVPPTNDIPVVTVRTLLSQIEEGAGPLDVFEVRRTGPLGHTLVVGFSLAGTATVGVDYALPFNLQSAEFARGADTARVVLRPVLDTRGEGRESVVLELRPPVPSSVTGVLPPYVLGELARAESHILDRVPPVAPSVVWQAPTNGTPFRIGDVLHLRVVATDPQGYLPDVEFLALDANGHNTRRIGTSAIRFFVAPTNGTPIAHELDWEATNAFAGANRIVARAPRANGEVVESTVLELTGHAAPVASIVWEAPTAGSAFEIGSTVHLRAVATDPHGSISSVEFRASDASGDNTRNIGMSNLSFLVAPADGTPIPHQMEWVTTNAFSGVNRITVHARRADGAEVASNALELTGQRPTPPPLPSVGIRVERDSATEGAPAEQFVFRIERSGPTTLPLTIHFAAEGTAIRGDVAALQREIDYWLELNPCALCARPTVLVQGNEVTIPAGADSVRIGGSALDEAISEGDETVILRLVPWLPPVSVGSDLLATAYLVDPAHPSAEAVLHDNDATPALPVVTVVEAEIVVWPVNVGRHDAREAAAVLGAVGARHDVGEALGVRVCRIGGVRRALVQRGLRYRVGDAVREDACREEDDERAADRGDQAEQCHGTAPIQSEAFF